MTKRFASKKEALDKLNTALHGCDYFPDVVQNLTLIQESIAHLSRDFDQAERPLTIILTGGTGVGKSTLLNAIASDLVAESSAIRPTTTAFTAFCHVNDDHSTLMSLPRIRISPHTLPGLKNKILIDAPDADSAISENRDLLESALKISDLALVVVSPEKYVSKSVLDLLRQYKRGIHFAFVLNKIDASNGCDLTSDLKSTLQENGFENFRIFPLSALNVLANRKTRSRAYDEGQFKEFETYLFDQLDQVRIQQIKKHNLNERSLIAAERVRSFLPAGFQDLRNRWLEECQIEKQKFLDQIAEQLRISLLNPDEIQPAVISRKYSGLSGIFGFFSTCLFLIKRAFRGGAFLSNANSAAIWMHQKWSPGQIARIDDAFELCLRSFVVTGTRFGLSENALEKSLADEKTARHFNLGDFLTGHIIPSIRAFIESRVKPVGSILNFLLNLPSFGWIGYWIYRLGNSLIPGHEPIWEELPGALIVWLLIAGVQWHLVNFTMERLTRRLTHQIIGLIISDAQKTLSIIPDRILEKIGTRISSSASAILTALKNIESAL